MRAFWVLSVATLVGCAEESIPTYPVTPPPTSTVTTTPYRHPRFTRDTTWIENNTGMTLVYESGEFAKSWSFREVTDTNEAVRKGWKAQRFEVRPGDCFGYDCTRSITFERNEFSQVADENVEGDEYWYAWSFYVPANIPQADWVFMGQFQQRSSYESIWMFMKRAGQPFCAKFDWVRTKMWDCVNYNGTYALINDSEFAGRWHDVLVHAKWTTQSDGFTEIYIDGELRVDYKGYTRTSGNSDVYFKYGIYRHASPQTSVVYYDEIRRGKTRAEVDITMK